MKDIDTIWKLVLKFRLAIENLTENDYGESSWFSQFPKGCCGDTCELLSKYLFENGIEAEFVNGVNDFQWHAWLEYKGYIIDITADQFPEISDKVVIRLDKKWYSRFKRQTREYKDFEADDKLNVVRLGQLYKNIIEKII